MMVKKVYRGDPEFTFNRLNLERAMNDARIEGLDLSRDIFPNSQLAEGIAQLNIYRATRVLYLDARMWLRGTYSYLPRGIWEGIRDIHRARSMMKGNALYKAAFKRWVDGIDEMLNSADRKRVRVRPKGKVSQVSAA